MHATGLCQARTACVVAVDEKEQAVRRVGALSRGIHQLCLARGEAAFGGEDVERRGHVALLERHVAIIDRASRIDGLSRDQLIALGLAQGPVAAFNERDEQVGVALVAIARRVNGSGGRVDESVGSGATSAAEERLRERDGHAGCMRGGKRLGGREREGVRRQAATRHGEAKRRPHGEQCAERGGVAEGGRGGARADGKDIARVVAALRAQGDARIEQGSLRQQVGQGESRTDAGRAQFKVVAERSRHQRGQREKDRVGGNCLLLGPPSRCGGDDEAADERGATQGCWDHAVTMQRRDHPLQEQPASIRVVASAPGFPRIADGDLACGVRPGR